MSKITNIITASLLFVSYSSASAQQLPMDRWSHQADNSVVSHFAYEREKSPSFLDGNEISYYLAGEEGDGILSLFLTANNSAHGDYDMTAEGLNNIEPAAGIRIKFKFND